MDPGGGGNGSIPGGGGAPFAPTVTSHNAVQDILLTVSGIMSFLGAATIILYTLLVYGHRLLLVRKLLIYISTADIICSAAWVYAGHMTVQMDDISTGCLVQGYVLQFFFLASFLWTACLARHLYEIFVKQMSMEEMKPRERYYHLISWGLPAISLLYFGIKSSFAGVDSSIGLDERPWCWISSSRENTSWALSGAVEQFVFFFFPLAIVLIHNTYATVRIFTSLPRIQTNTLYNFQNRGSSSKKTELLLAKLSKVHSRLRFRLSLFLLVFLLVVLPGFVNRIYQVFSKDHHPQPKLVYLEAFMFPSQGFFNLLVYGVSARTLSRIMDCWCACCSYCLPRSWTETCAMCYHRPDNASRRKNISGITAEELMRESSFPHASESEDELFDFEFVYGHLDNDFIDCYDHEEGNSEYVAHDPSRFMGLKEDPSFYGEERSCHGNSITEEDALAEGRLLLLPEASINDTNREKNRLSKSNPHARWMKGYAPRLPKKTKNVRGTKSFERRDDSKSAAEVSMVSLDEDSHNRNHRSKDSKSRTAALGSSSLLFPSTSRSDNINTVKRSTNNVISSRLSESDSMSTNSDADSAMDAPVRVDEYFQRSRQSSDSSFYYDEDGT